MKPPILAVVLLASCGGGNDAPPPDSAAGDAAVDDVGVDALDTSFPDVASDVGAFDHACVVENATKYQAPCSDGVCEFGGGTDIRCTTTDAAAGDAMITECGDIRCGINCQCADASNSVCTCRLFPPH